MADSLLTLTQIEDVFQALTVSMIGSSPAADVRISWPIGGAPAFKATDNVAFLKVYEVPSPISVQREEEFAQVGSPAVSTMKMGYSRTLQINWIFYGSAGWDNSLKVANGLFYQENHDVLALNNLYMVPDFQPAKRVPELFQGMWYERMDLNILFNEKVEISRELHNIETVEIIVEDYSGIKATIDIEE